MIVLILTVAVTAFASGYLLSTTTKSGSVSDTKRKYVNAVEREAIATKALRNIASNIAGNPQFEAQVALDDISAHYTKGLKNK